MISIIIPVYHVEEYLAECLDSVLGQTYRDLEIILVDDGSADACPAICDEYAGKDERIIVIHQQNQGLSGARNAGLDVAKGEYVTFLDADDRYTSSEVLEKMHAQMVEQKADILFSKYRRINEAGKPLEEKREQGISRVIDENQFWSLWEKREDNSLVVVYTKLYRRKIWETLRYPVGKIHEDEWVLHDVIRQCDRMVLTDIVSIDYRQRTNSIIHTNFCLKNLFKCGALAERMDYIMEKGLHQFEPQIFAEGTVVLLMGYARLDLRKDREARRYVRTYYNRYKEFARAMLPRTVEKKQKLRLCIFLCSLRAYRFVRNRMSRNKI